MVLNAQSAGQQRVLFLQPAVAAGDEVEQLQARVMVLEDIL
jgi:hypothetical protein